MQSTAPSKNRQRLTNRQAALAETARAAYGGYLSHRRKSREDWVHAAQALAEARELCEHGDWLPFLEATGIGRTTAERMLRVVRSGIEMRHVTHFGVRATLEVIEHAEKWRKDPYAEMAVAKIGGPIQLMQLFQWYGHLAKLAGEIAKHDLPDGPDGWGIADDIVMILAAKLRYEIARGRGPWEATL